MSWLDTSLKLTGEGKAVKIESPLSNYQPKDLEQQRLLMLRADFAEGDIVMKRPRREFNDLSMLERMAIDQMAFAVYQPNDGDSLSGDEINGWRSNAVRPIVRNKIISINAHVTARTIYPKILAFNTESEEEKDASTVMGDLMEWSVTSSNSAYADISVQATTSALVNPISWVYTQYQTVMRPVKRRKKDDGSWETELIVDEDQSGFIDESVAPDQVYFGEFYVRNGDVQLQPWLIRRKIINYSTAAGLFSRYPNWQYVRPGIMVIFNDANQQFYETYDSDMHQNEVEVVYYWNKALDLYLIAVNGVMLTDADNPNPREDKLYPWSTFGYELLRPQGDCMAYKSLAFKTMPDDKVINTLYPMIIDASYLALFPPTIAVGVETIGSDVLIPGLTTTLSDPQADLRPVMAANQNLQAAYEALLKVETNINESSIDSQEAAKQDPDSGGPPTAYAISKEETHAKILLGSFLHMVGRYVKQMGRLRIGDIKQHLTLPELQAIEGSAGSELVYKTFHMGEGRGRTKGRKIQFDLSLPEGKIDRSKYIDLSHETLDMQGGMKSPYKLYRVNPKLFRQLKYMIIVAPDVLAPLSDEYEAQLALEQYDRMIQQPEVFDAEQTGRILLEAYKLTKKNPDKYLSQGQAGGPAPQVRPSPGQSANPMKGGAPLPPPGQGGKTQISPLGGLPPMPSMMGNK